MDCSALPPGVKELSILLTNDATIQKLNASYRDKHKPTDVLSFSQLEGRPQPLVPESALSLGDIVISLETAKRQAPKYGNVFEAEVLRLLIHGLLHLLGYEHVGVAAKIAAKMRRKERRLFKLYCTEVT